MHFTVSGNFLAIPCSVKNIHHHLLIVACFCFHGQGEMAAELHRATTFIVDRELEAPDRFQAIQSYRAASAVLRQQSRFIDQLHTSGVLDAGERETLLAPVTQRTERLEIQGPTWTAPSVQQVLRSLPFLHHVPREVFDAVLERGTLKGERKQPHCCA